MARAHVAVGTDGITTDRSTFGSHSLQPIVAIPTTKLINAGTTPPTLIKEIGKVVTPAPAKPSPMGSQRPPGHDPPIDTNCLYHLTRCWKLAWPPGGTRCVVKNGLSWWWSRVPPLRVPLPVTKINPDVKQHVTNMLCSSIIKPAWSRVFLSHLSTVPKLDSTKGRLIIDLSHLNKFIHTILFKMVVSISQIQLHLQQQQWLVSFNLQDTTECILAHPPATSLPEIPVLRNQH